MESNADSLIWFAAPAPAKSAEIELDLQHTRTRASQQATCGIAGHTGNWVYVAANETQYSLYSSITDTNALERSVLLFKWEATPEDPNDAGESSLSVQGITRSSFARNTTEATGIAMLNYDNGGWNPYYAYARVWSVRAKVGDWEVKGTPCLNTQGVPVMYDANSKKDYPPTKGNNFIAGFTLAQARNLRKLPATGGSLTVSLPWEAQLIASGIPAILQAAAAKGWTITVQYRDPEANNEYYNRYAECVTVADIQAINPDYKNDLTSDGEWVYPLPELINSTGAFAKNANLVSFDADLPELTNGVSMFRNMPKMEKFKGSLKALRYGQEMCCYSYSVAEFDATLESLTEGIYMFLGCQLNKESALKILHSLPSYTTQTHNFHIGIHVDYKLDEEVLAAIADAEAKGWNVAVGWNGTATAQTASTFGLRKPPIYAKLGTVERPDGTPEQILDWVHYVTNWEENGYQEFSSVEEANEYFNIESETEE